MSGTASSVVAAGSRLTANACGGPGLTVTASPPSAATSTEPPAPAVTVKVIGMSSKLASAAASAVTEPTASTQLGPGVAPNPHTGARVSDDSVQRAKR